MTFCPRCRRTFDDGVRFCPVDGAQVEGNVGIDDRNLGRVLANQFEILDVCGRGAMGMVYRAQQRTMDRIVAVKILRRELLQEPDVVKRFVREARAAAKLQHPNIVTVHMVGETDDKLPFLVMEYIDGISLEAVCDGAGPLGLQRSVRLARQIVSALEEAHGNGIIHRDLKPANILLYEKGTKTDRVKVLDFGIAKIVQPDGAGESILTRDGMIFGTPHYIAPEQATGAEVDARADLYSLGVILFRMATGRLPFEGTAGMQVVLRHLREPAPSPRSLHPAVPPALDALILKCLAKDRAQRPADAEEISAELAFIEEALPPDTAPAGATGKVKALSTGQVRALGSGSSRTWQRPAIFGGVVLAVAGGTALGLLAARSRHHAVAPEVKPIAAAPAPAPPALADPPMVDEHVLAEDGITLRAGFAKAPSVGPAELAILFSGVAGQPRVEVALAVEKGVEKLTEAHAAGENRWLAPLVLGGGRQHVRVIAHTPKNGPPLVLSFDVEPPVLVHAAAPAPAPAPERAARPEPRRVRPAAANSDDLPVTIVPAEHKPPRAIVATPVQRTAPSAPAPATNEPAPPPAPYPTTRVVVDHPKPVKPPREAAPPPPAPEQPAEDPPTRPNDPTTLPPPNPDEPR